MSGDRESPRSMRQREPSGFSLSAGSNDDDYLMDQPIEEIHSAHDPDGLGAGQLQHFAAHAPHEKFLNPG